jgi:hypothetical protein
MGPYNVWDEYEDCERCHTELHTSELYYTDETLRTPLCEPCIEETPLIYFCDGGCEVNEEGFESTGIPTSCPNCGNKRVSHSTHYLTELIKSRQDTLEKLADMCRQPLVTPKLLLAYMEGKL